MQINVTRPYLPKQEEFNEIIKSIWENNWLTNNGPLVQSLQKKLQEFLKVTTLHLTVNGHTALETALSAYQLKGKVITTPFTFASTTHAIVRQGLVPVYCDIRSDDFTIDPDKIESLIDSDTCAIVPVHVYGHPCKVEQIKKIAEKYNLKVIYDAAHSFGVRYKEKSLCDYGNSSILSFHATKLFNTIEGGAIISHDPDYSKRVEELKNYGIISETEVVLPGGNAKMNEFQAAMGLANLKNIYEIMIERRKITLLYRKLLNEIRGITYFVPENDDVVYNYSYMPIIVEPKEYGISRDELYERLKSIGINCRRYFYPLTSEFSCYKNYAIGNTPIAHKIAMNVLTLPLYNGLSLDDVELICNQIRENSKQ